MPMDQMASVATPQGLGVVPTKVGTGESCTEGGGLRAQRFVREPAQQTSVLVLRIRFWCLFFLLVNHSTDGESGVPLR